MTATLDDIWDVLECIPDPELPISIVDLGIVERVAQDAGRVHVTITPTFVGCPALNVVYDEVRKKVGALDGIEAVTVNISFDPPWSPDRMSLKGRDILRTLGVGVPEPEACIGSRLSAADATSPEPPVPCPWCNSTDTTMSSPFGAQRCRMIYYCNACKKPFEQFKAM